MAFSFSSSGLQMRYQSDKGTLVHIRDGQRLFERKPLQPLLTASVFIFMWSSSLHLNPAGTPVAYFIRAPNLLVAGGDRSLYLGTHPNLQATTYLTTDAVHHYLAFGVLCIFLGHAVLTFSLGRDPCGLHCRRYECHHTLPGLPYTGSLRPPSSYPSCALTH